jgi:cysteine desulfurase / selenocysteine lyase
MNVGSVRAQFPALRPRNGRPPPAYLDSACLSLVPDETLRTIEEYYTNYPGCAGRSVHRYAEEVGRRYEEARAAFGRFFGVAEPARVVFLRNATEAINLVAQGLDWKPGDRVLVSDREHNSNLVVWQRLVRERGIGLDILPLPEDRSFDAEAYEAALARRPRWVSLFHTSNLDGRTLPLDEIVQRAHDRGARVLLDGCQAAPHLRVDLERSGVDAYAVSAHKMLGPTGVGVLVGSSELLGSLRPPVLGGETVEWTTLTDHELRPPPYRFEAGLQNYAGVLGARAGLRFLERIGLPAIASHQLALNREVERELSGERRVHRLGPVDPAERPSIYAFYLDGVDPHDAAIYLDEGHDVLVRSGRHCVHSFYEARGLVGSVRASFYLYNDRSEARALAAGVRELLERVPGRLSGTSAERTSPSSPAGRARRRASGSAGAAARSARPRRTEGRGRAGSARGSG